ncbi:MAG: hypothetical protein OES79_02650 [Planctomycetota bacterium]|nr:hypothetical protein [Planctomycetota bacterium]
MSLSLFFQIFAGILLILFLVALFMGFKSWRIHTVIMLLLVFLSGMTTLVMAGMVLQTHSAWRAILQGPPGQREEGLIHKTQQLEQEIHDLRFGKRNQTGELVADGIVQTERQLRQAMFDRGRVWRECKPAPMGGGATSVQVRIGQPKPARIRANSTLFVFDGKTVAEGGAYLGEFKVTNVVDPGAADAVEAGEEAAAPAAGAAAAEATVSLEASWNLTTEELKQLEISANRGGPWILYEKMPADSHTVFHKVTAEELGVTKKQLREVKVADRREVLAPDRLKQLLPNLPDDVLDEYKRDHQKPAEGDPPARIEMKVKFDDDFQVEGPNQESFKYERRQNVWLPKESLKDEAGTTIVPGADELAAAGTVDVKDERYFRALRDYSLLFRQIYLQRNQLVDSNNALDFDIKNIQTVLADKQKVLEDFEEENRRLREDVAGFQRDLKVLSKLEAEVQQQNTTARGRADQLRKQNVQLAERLDRAQMEAVRTLNRRAPSPQARQDATSPSESPAQLATAD